MSEQPSAGWYPDPSGRPGQQYWDGRQWRTDVAPPGGNPSQQPQGGYPAVAPYGAAPYGLDAYGRPLSDKSKLTAGLLQILLGSFGVGRFYLGYTTIGILQIVVTWLTCGLGAVWPLIDGIMIITGKVPDAQGRTLSE
ncbi:NINE protein [Mycobacterium sp.]|uniref:NINE protein n=1 Tax=Mycobacterium sp. TaxID=1785 RepID=UPI0025F03AA7|nr:NINE protein [Mycobacterium sp.]MBW0012757.1 NINE protein [Mycobacterium sp.]